MRGRGAPLAATVLALALLVAVGCRREGEAPPDQIRVFGTVAEVRVRGGAPDQVAAAIAEASTRVRQREREWHAWQDSDLTRINEALRAGRSADAPTSILMLLRRSRQFNADSGGLFDPSVGGLVDLWGFHSAQFPVTTPAPSMAQIGQWRQHRPRLQDIVVVGGRISSHNPAAQLDFNSIAEGAAVEEILQIFEQHGIHHALVNMGGDVVALGDDDGQPWRVEMKDPYGGTLGEVGLGDHEAFFVSGNYNKFREAGNGGRWGHILDPRTGMPARGSAAAAVLHPDPMLADAASTALMVAGPAGFDRIVRGMRIGCALLVTDENEVLMTRAMQRRMRFLRRPIVLGQPLDMGADCRP